VRAVQKTGESTRDLWHKTDWDKVKKDPESIGFPREEWIHQFDAEKHAEETFDEVMRTIVEPPVVAKPEPVLSVAEIVPAVVAS
jgi:hypothetical protein